MENISRYVILSASKIKFERFISFYMICRKIYTCQPLFSVLTAVNAYPGNELIHRYHQANATNTTHKEEVSMSEVKEDESLFNNTIHLLDFLSQLIRTQEGGRSENVTLVDSTFEETMGKLDAIIAELDEASMKPPEETEVKMARPRLEDSGSESAAKYEALVELKNILDDQFSDYTKLPRGSDYMNPHTDQSLRSDFHQAADSFNDTERLKLPLVGVPNADPSNIPMNEEALNLLVKQGVNPGVSIYPVSDSDELKNNITDLIGIDFDDLIKEVSHSIGQVNQPLRVEEHHTQVTEREGAKPVYKYTETIADVTPNEANLRDPTVNILAKRYEEGGLLSTEGKTRFRWVPNGDRTQEELNVSPIRGLGPTLEDVAGTSAGDVKVNVTTKTNIVNVFTFNIFVNNGTKASEKNSFTLVKDAPVRSSIQTTANIDSNDSLTGKPLNSISLYQYQASDDSTTNDRPKIADSGGESESASTSANGGAEMEKWLKILLNHQAYGDGSNIVAEAVLKDASLQQLPPESRTADAPMMNYRRMDEPSTMSPLGYRTDLQGDLILEQENDKVKEEETKGLMESIAGSPLPTLIAGLAAVSPALLTVLGRKRRDLEDVEIPQQWLSYLLGTRYASSTLRSTDVPQESATEALKPNEAGQWSKYGSTAVKFSPERRWKTTKSTTSTTTTTTTDEPVKWTKYGETTLQPTVKWTKYAESTTKNEDKWTKYGANQPTVNSIETTTLKIEDFYTPNSIKVKKQSNIEPKSNSNKVNNLMDHWKRLYNSVKTVQVPIKNNGNKSFATP